MNERLYAILRKTLVENGNKPSAALGPLATIIMKDRVVRDLACMELLTRAVGPAAGTGAAGHLLPDAHETGAGGATPRRAPAKPVRVKEHSRQSPLHMQARQNAMVSPVISGTLDTFKINGRSIGDIAFDELGLIVRRHAERAAGHLQLGVEETVIALVANKIKLHCVPADTSARVREIIREAQLKDFIGDAMKETPLLINKGTRTQKAAIIEHERSTDVAA